MTKNETTEKKPRVLKHVKVYDRLFAMIKDGTFAPGAQLPSEPLLAQQMDVSRMTLRKALALLQEDGLIKNIQGKGNFVKGLAQAAEKTDREPITHPIQSCCLTEYTQVESEFRIEPPSEYMREKLKQDTAAVVIADRWYKTDEEVFGYTLTFLSIECISKYNVNLSNPESLKQFLENDIYTLSADSTVSYSYTTTGNFTSEKYSLSKKSNFMLLSETLYDQNHSVLAYSKHYVPLKDFKLVVHRTTR